MKTRNFLIVTALALAGCATTSTPTQREQIAFFNHGYAVLDPETAEAISQSGFLRTFMVFEQRTTHANDGNQWTARYLYGRETYFEFFAPSDLGPGMERPEGATGLAVSPDRAGGLTVLGQRLTASNFAFILAPRTRLLGETQVDWFNALALQSSFDNTLLATWAMEYAPSYFEADNKEPTQEADDAISRERYHSDDYRQRLARDVSAIEIGAPSVEIAEAAPLFRAAGFEVIERNGGLEARDGDMRITLIAAEGEEAGLRRLEFVLNAPAARRVERIGRSTLTVGPGRSAVWTFD
jgi:Family of unknown function (DUF5829)